MFRFSCVWIITSIFAFSSFVFAQNVEPTILKGKLKNGLTYYVSENPHPQGETIYRLFLKTGSTAEKHAQRGLAHFLEHMAFNGTRHFPGDSLVRFLEQQGAKFGKDLNAHTSYDETVYKLQLPSKDTVLVDQTLTILADWLGGLQLDSLAIEKERGIIFSEWLSRKTAGQEVQEAFLNALLNGSHYVERKVIGDTSVILRAPAEEIRSYYKDWYSPALAAVAVVGDINPSWIIQRINDKFGSIPSQNVAQVFWPIPNYDTATFRKIISDGERKAELNIIRLLDKPNPVRNKSEHLPFLEGDLLRLLLRARFSDLSFQNPPYTKGGVQISNFLNQKQILLANIGINPDKPDSSIMSFANQVAQLVQYGFDTNEIARIKKSYEAQLKRKASSNRPTLSAAIIDDVYDDFYNNQPPISPQDELDWYNENILQIDSISLLKRLRSAYHPYNAYYLLTGYSQIDSILPTENQILTWFDEAYKKEQPRYHKALEITTSLMNEEISSSANIIHTAYKEAIEADEVWLSNGSRVLFRNPIIERDRITITGFRKGGLYTLDSMDYVSGLYAGQVAALSGAGTLNRESLAHYLTGNSASVRFLIDKARTGIAGSAEPKDLETLLQLIYIKWTEPRVDKEIFSQIKSKAIDNYRHTQKTPSYLFNRDLGYLINGNDYVNREVTDSIIDAELDIDRVLPIFNQAFGLASGFTFIVTVDTSDIESRDLILNYLGALPYGEPDTAYLYVRPTIVGGDTLIRKNGDAPNTTVWLTYQTDTIDMEYHHFQLHSDIMAAVLRMQLLRELREEMGKIYSVGVSSSGSIYPTPLTRASIRFACAADDAELLIATIEQRIEHMINNPISFVSLLEDVKSNLRKEMELDKQRDTFWTSYIRNSLFNLDENMLFVQQYDHLLDNITPQSIADFMRTYIGNVKPIKAILYPGKLQSNQNTKTKN